MKIKSANSFALVDINQESIEAYAEKYKKKGKIEEAAQLKKVLEDLASETVTADVIEKTVNKHFDKNLQEIKALRKQIRKLDKSDDSRKELRNQIKLISKANKALIPFSKRQRLRLAAIASIKR